MVTSSSDFEGLNRGSPTPASGAMGDEVQTSSEEERRSLDLVQRSVVSLLLGAVIGMVVAVLAFYVVTRGRYELPYDSVIGLWIMVGVLGVVGASTVLVLNRKRFYHPLALIGLIPMAAAAYWLFG